MDLTSEVIKRPVATMMVCLAVLLFGCLSAFRVPVDLLPDVDFPVVAIETKLPGYSPSETENLITKPIESMLSTMNGLHRIQSVSSEGVSLVQLQFELGMNMDYASAELREKLDLIRDTFPKDTRTPLIKKYNPSESPVMTVAAYGRIPPGILSQLVDEVIEKRLRRIDGVGNIEVKGAREKEILVEIDHERLKAFGISISEIADLLKANNLNLEVGSILEGPHKLRARVEGEYRGLSQLRKVAIGRTLSGSGIYLSDIGEIAESFRREESRARFQGEPRIMLYIMKESGGNILGISETVKEELARVREILPRDIRVEIIYDQADYVKAAMKRLRDEALVGAVCAMAVLFAFLRNVAGVLLIGMAIPISIVATFALMYATGVPLNIISFSGFTLGIGMLVDNGIVVIDNICKKRELNLDRTGSVLVGVQEIVKAISISTFAHVAVFFPVIFVQKQIKMMYGSLFFTISFSLLASLLVALTVVPLLSSKVNLLPLWGREGRRTHTQGYRRLLVWSLRNRGRVLSSAAILFLCSLLLIPMMGFESMARMDRGVFTVMIRMPPGTSLSVSDRAAVEAEGILLRSPDVQDVSTDVSAEAIQIRVRLRSDRKGGKTTRETVEELRPQLNAIPLAQVHFDLDTGTSKGNKLILEVYGSDQKELMALAFEAKRRLSKTEGIADTVIYQSNPKPEMQVKVLHDKAGAYGLTASGIAEAVRSRITGPIATEFVEKGKEIDLRVRLRGEDLRDLSILDNISIPVQVDGKERSLIPLKEVTSSKLDFDSAEIHRRDQRRMIAISADIGQNDLGRMAQRVEGELGKMQFKEGYGYRFGEDYQKLKESQREMIFAFALALILMYMILASHFESFSFPLIIIFSVPMAIIGSLALLYLSGKTINIPVYVGAITLVGIVVNNAIVLIDYINLLKSRGLGSWRAIIRGGESRLRPILMTSLTTCLALMPMAFDKGESSNLWSPLALTIVGGLVTSTLLSLIILPILMSFFKEVREGSS